MSLLDLLSDEDCWRGFYEYKTSLCGKSSFTKELEKFIDEKKYLPVCELIGSGAAFPCPRKSVISKTGTSKKRTVYTYPYAENTVLKLLTYLILRKYDGLFSGCLYSFRPGRCAKDAVRKLMRTRGVKRMYSYKADIHDYFNSVPTERLTPMLDAALSDDPRLLSFLKKLLCDPYVIENGKKITEKKGIMAGTPLSSFYANLYLNGLDRHFEEAGVVYARYSDDMILFAGSEEETRTHAEFIRGYLGSAGLTINPDKESFCTPDDGFTFLGFVCKGGKVDIAPVTVAKLKAKMRRKTRALTRWRQREEKSCEKAAAAFIRIFNRKLLEHPEDNDLTWSYWFFPVINTTESLHEIDAYAQDCVRYLLSGKRTKARYDVRYSDMKALGYKSLVHAYYDFEKEQNR